MQLVNLDAWFLWAKTTQQRHSHATLRRHVTSTAMKQPEDKHLKISLPVRRRHWAFLRFYSNCTTDYVPVFEFFSPIEYYVCLVVSPPPLRSQRRPPSSNGRLSKLCSRGVRWWCGHLRWHDAAHKLGRVICVAKTTQHRHSHATIWWHVTGDGTT